MIAAPAIERLPPGAFNSSKALVSMISCPATVPPVQSNWLTTVNPAVAYNVAPPPRFTVPTSTAASTTGAPLVMVAVSVEPGVPAGVQFVAVNQLLETAPFQM